ncbi:MAG: conjugal transfer protein TraX [Oscillospiraceae bacterium]|nr:conjugal transfer protein TraX [Oscillospiraceae bacterium]
MELREKRGVPGSVLKWVAILAMFIDHAAVILVYGWAKFHHGWGPGVESTTFYYILRGIGRLGFPIFCFLLVEGFFHTRNRRKYLLRLGLFALISELPFDLAFRDTWKTFGRPEAGFWARWGLEFTHQNVFFTLFLGLLAVMLWDGLTRGGNEEGPVWRGLAAVVCALALGAAAHYGETDYGAMGVALILVLYLLHDRPWERDLLAGGVLAAMIPFGSHWIELFGIAAFPLFHLYNGRRGRQMKYFFYVFYPAHLLLLLGIGRLLFRPENLERLQALADGVNRLLGFLPQA